MKNVTLTLDDEVHRKARIRAAELGTSLSALVKDYLVGLVDDHEAPVRGVREMPLPYHAQPAGLMPPLPPKYHTKDGKPRQPGALRGMIQMSDDWDEWPQDILKSFETWDYDDQSADQ